MGSKLLRFADLKAAGIVSNHPQLKRMVLRYGFPPGIKLGENTTAWRPDEVEVWLASRPTKAYSAQHSPEAASIAG